MKAISGKTLHRKKTGGGLDGRVFPRVSVQGVESLGGHFLTLCRGFDFYEVKINHYHHFLKIKEKYFYTFNHF